jgi:hypothetical protein
MRSDGEYFSQCPNSPNSAFQDERLRIMSGTIAALIPQRGTSTRLREHYNRLIVRIEVCDQVI